MGKFNNEWLHLWTEKRATSACKLHFNQQQVRVLISHWWLTVVGLIKWVKEPHSIDLTSWKPLWVVSHQKQKSRVFIQKVYHLYRGMAKQEVPFKNLKRNHKVLHETKKTVLCLGPHIGPQFLLWNTNYIRICSFLVIILSCIHFWRIVCKQLIHIIACKS